MRDAIAERAGLVNALMLAVAVVGATLFAISPLLPDIAHAFGVDVARAGILPGAFGLSLAVVAPLVGLGAQDLPRTRIIILGLLAFALVWLLAIVVSVFEILVLLAMLAGAATGAVLPAAYACAADLVDYAQRARVMGRIVSGWSLAILLVVPMMGAAAQWVNWRWAFAALAGCALVIAGWLAVMQCGWPGGEASRLPARAKGDALDRDSGPSADAVRAIGAATLLRDLRAVLRDRCVQVLLAANLLDMGAFYAVYSFAGAELRRVNDWGASPASLTVACYGIGLALVTFNGRLIDRWGKRRSAIAALCALGFVLSGLPWLVGSPLMMAAAIVVWGLIQGTFFTAITTLASEQFTHLRGVVVALLSGSTYFGVSLYTPLSSWIYAQAGYRAVGLEAAAGCLLAAALLAFTRGGRLAAAGDSKAG